MLCLALLAASPAIAQKNKSGKAPKDSKRKEMKDKLGGSSFEAWKAERDRQFAAFVSERDKAFADFLRQRWEDAGPGQAEEKPLPAPKPVSPPAFTPSPKPPQPKPLPVVPPAATPTPKPAGDTITTYTPLPIRQEVQPPQPVSQTFALRYMGLNMSVEWAGELPVALSGKPTEESIAQFWSQMAATAYGPVVNQTLAMRERYRLNDWAYLQLVRALAREVFPADEQRQVLLSWFVLVKAQCRARVGFDDQKIYLLVPFVDDLYAMRYYRLDEAAYYALDIADDRPVRLRVYGRDPDGVVGVMSIRMDESPLFPEQQAERTVSFYDRLGTKHTVSIPYNPHLIEFYAQYPWVDFPVYFQAEVSQKTREALLTTFRQMTQGMNEYDQVSLLLSFVQNAFQYETDDKQFGREKPLFVEESLHYPYSDCEDRCILFAWLVRQVAGLEVRGVLYPGHLATAVAFRSEVNGDFFQDPTGNKFVMCDPTYIGAPVGRTMPQYVGAEAKLVPMR